MCSGTSRQAPPDGSANDQIVGKWLGWQNGYGAFTVSASQVSRVREYIRNQEAHHRRVSFQEEFVRMLKKNGVEYDERYLWD